MKTFEGNLSAEGTKFGIVVSRFNELITGKLLDGAVDCLKRHGAEQDKIDVAWVPGAFELPQITKKMALAGKYDGIICLGALIRGQTPHFEYISSAVVKGISDVALDSGIPISFGVLTTENLEQAMERAGSKAGNKGQEAASALIEMTSLFRSFLM